jgi:hypothetical protein
MLIDGITQLLSFQVTDSVPDGLQAYADQIHTVAAQVQGRVYENELPRGYRLPAIAVHQYGGAQDYDFSGPISINEDQVQLDCYGQDSLSCRATAEAARKLLENFTGTLPDGTVVQACYKERDQAMPFLPNADQKGIANRWMLGFRVVKQRV